MVLLENILLHGTITCILLIAYLLPIMRFTSPRIWGYSDYPDEIKELVPPQTKEERKQASILFIPFVLMMLGIPIISTMILEVSYGGTLPLLDAFLNAFGVLMMGNLADLFILDWIVVGTITPSWVMLPGTEEMKDTAYKDFRWSHAKGHIPGTLFLAALSLLSAFIVVSI
ncbi:MAG: nitroreductase [Candidatus Thorarchaeota archaeon]|nr:nitroreductase [Candidatus Thorarchaeota archaeon]